jgi:hypothetical protein
VKVTLPAQAWPGRCSTIGKARGRELMLSETREAEPPSLSASLRTGGGSYFSVPVCGFGMRVWLEVHSATTPVFAQQRAQLQTMLGRDKSEIHSVLLVPLPRISSAALGGPGRLALAALP